MQADQLKSLLESQAWHLLVLRLNQEVQRAQDQVLVHLDKGEYKESHQASGLVQGFKICLGLPLQMVREMEKENEHGTSS